MVGRGQKLTGWFSLILVAIIALGIFLQHIWNVSLGWIGWPTLAVIILYLFFVRQIFLFEKKNPPPAITDEKYEDTSLKRTFVYFAISAALIIGAGIWLALIGDQIAESTGLEKNFIGSLLIGLTTTLPEITVSYSALRLGAPDMAVSNMIGSNMFNMFLIGIDDIMYTQGAILGAVSLNNLITAVTVIAMSLVTIAGLYFKPRRLFRLSWYNVIVILFFFIGAVIAFIFSR
jgi:cation:H+ antiporter